MIDYKEKMIALFQRYYLPEGEEYQKKLMSTMEIFVMFSGVLPNQPITEHDVYEMLEEVGYHQEREILYNEVVVVEEDKKRGIKEEIDLVEAGVIFKWVIFEKM
jgi:hypothetical protein